LIAWFIETVASSPVVFARRLAQRRYFPFVGTPAKDCLVSLLGIVLLSCALGTLFLVPLMILREGYPAFFEGNGLWGLLVADGWEPLADPAKFGLRHALMGTVTVTAVALLAAAPVGFGIGLFLAEVAPAIVRKLLQPCLELLAGIPSVVYGFFGYVTLVPWFEQNLEMSTGECVLAAGLVLAVMILPFVASTAAEAFRAVPADLKEAALALGVNRWSLARAIIMRYARAGMFAALALGLARALGETLAVLMLAGNSLALPVSLLDRGQPITALIVTELGEAAAGSPKYHALFSAALVLLAVIAAINVLIGFLKQKYIYDAA
jgi:phosphate ABC transporter permease protein PstC